MEWQPIETAPKDGTPVLVWCDHEEVTVGWNYGKSWNFENLDCRETTHWMPLPEPPK